MTKLLVSVRSVEEAIAAIEGGAQVIDVKEPDRGPLGRADVAVWREVRQVVPPNLELSVALGELVDWFQTPPLREQDLAGIDSWKLGLANAPEDWAERWLRLHDQFPVKPNWVAVVYADWERAKAPRPEDVLQAALKIASCKTVLIDTWTKSEPSPLDETWGPFVSQVRASGKRVALAGGLNGAMIARLSCLEPDLFAVRGAACRGRDRRAAIDRELVAQLCLAIKAA